MIERMCTPMDDAHNEHKKLQLRELAALNGTLKDEEVRGHLKFCVCVWRLGLARVGQHPVYIAEQRRPKQVSNAFHPTSNRPQPTLNRPPSDPPDPGPHPGRRDQPPRRLQVAVRAGGARAGAVRPRRGARQVRVCGCVWSVWNGCWSASWPACVSLPPLSPSFLHSLSSTDTPLTHSHMTTTPPLPPPPTYLTHPGAAPSSAATRSTRRSWRSWAARRRRSSWGSTRAAARSVRLFVCLCVGGDDWGHVCWGGPWGRGGVS
jgi:hypothetical protein